MTLTRNDKDRLNALREETDAAHKAARDARLEVTRAYVQCAAGQGGGPSIKQIEEAERLERKAEELWQQLDAVLLHFTF